MEYISKFITIDNASATPKYMQLVNSIVKGINSGKIQEGDILPSINFLNSEFQIARVTIEKAYSHLKQMGIVSSYSGKGYFISNTAFRHTNKILLLFNKLSAHKKVIYDAFCDELRETSSIDFYVYNNDFNFFKKIIVDKITKDYTHFVIIPHFIDAEEFAHTLINTIDPQKLIIIDKQVKGVNDTFGMVYENFSNDIYEALKKAIDRLQRYDKLKILFSEHSYYPREILTGFTNFCQDYAFNHEILYSPDYDVNTGDVVICVMEDDLVKLIEKIVDKQLIIGQEIGLISYNETPLKKLILNGITTVSTNFKEMGKMAAQLILTNSRQHIEVPFEITLRDSL